MKLCINKGNILHVITIVAVSKYANPYIGPLNSFFFFDTAAVTI